MDESGSFAVTKTTVRKRTARQKYAGYRSFICALLTFLAVLILISVLMYALRHFGDVNEEETDKSQNENLFGQDTDETLDDLQKHTPAVNLPTKEILTDPTTTPKEQTTISYVNSYENETENTETVTETTEAINGGIQSTTSLTNTNYLFKVIPYNHTIILPVLFTVPTTKLPEPTTTATSNIEESTTSSTSLKTPVVTAPKYDFLNPLISKLSTSVLKVSIPSVPTLTVPPVVNKSVSSLLQPNFPEIVNPKPTGLFGINSKPIGKIVNKQISALPGLTIRTANNPPACVDPVCKRAASSMLAIQNHADQLNYCEDYYSAICQNPGPDHNEVFLRNNFRKILKTINTASGNSIKYFNSFFKQCNDYGNSINRINRINALRGTGGTNVEDAVINSILTQSMPFFDVGINIVKDKFVFEMTLPGLNYLKTNIKGWSLREQFKDSCIAEITDGVSQNVLELDGLSNKIDDCINDLTSRYLNDFLNELEPISKLPGMNFLGGILTKISNININPFAGRNLNPFSSNAFGSRSGGSATTVTTNKGDSKTDLIEIMQQVQNSWTVYRKVKNPSPKLRLISLEDLTSRYNLGIDWTDVFQKLTKSAVDDDTKIYFSEYLDQIFKFMVKKKSNLKEILDLWYNVQFYKNTVIEKQLNDRAHYCMDLVAQLMPEVSSFLISDLNKNRNQLYDFVENILVDLKQGFEKSLRSANFNPDSIKTIQNRINQINMARPILPALSSGLLNLKMFDYWSISGTYQDQLVQLLKHYKKMLYDQVSKDVTGETLLQYFVYAFDTEPKTYPPYREIVYQPGFTEEMAKNLPNFIRLAKHGLPLAKQFSQHFVKNDFIPSLDPKDVAVYTDVLKNFDTRYLVDKSKYNIEYIDCEIEDASGKNFKYESVVGDNFAFRLVSDMYLEDPGKFSLPFIDDTQNRTFITVALQDFCKTNDLFNFIGDFYDMKLPAPIRVKNMALNSELFAEAYGCPLGANRKQFPFIKRN